MLEKPDVGSQVPPVQPVWNGRGQRRSFWKCESSTLKLIARVRERKASWPAVSHIWSLIFWLSISTSRCPNSTPMVISCSARNLSCARQSTIELLLLPRSLTKCDLFAKGSQTSWFDCRHFCLKYKCLPRHAKTAIFVAQKGSSQRWFVFRAVVNKKFVSEGFEISDLFFEGF